jgi:uncharacterized protein DUF3311
MTPAARWLQVLLAAFTPVMLTLMIPLVNRVEPRIFGFPFLLAWMVFWVAVTPLFLFAADRLGRKV